MRRQRGAARDRDRPAPGGASGAVDSGRGVRPRPGRGVPRGAEGRAGRGGARGAASGAAPKGALDAEGREALARDAFAALKRRDFERFGTLLCARARQKYSRPDTKDTLPLAARGFAARGTELGAVLANEPRYVHFVQNERDAGQGAVVPVSSGKAFSVGLDRDADGRTCVDGFGTLARSVR